MEVTQPTLFVDKDQVLKNIEKMVAKAKASKVLFRPHFKTHHSTDIGEWFKQFSVEAIAVSSVDMAEYFAENGWKDITIAFSVNIKQIDRINKLANKIKLGLLIESQEAVDFLEKKLTAPVDIWVKIDTDYHRTGIYWDNEPVLSKLLRYIRDVEKLNFVGFLTHSGHSYYTKDKCEIEEVYADTVLKLKDIQERLFLQGFPSIKLSIGDTPTCSVISDFSEVDEIRPGNFVFYDVMQLELGTCDESEIAVALACPVVARHEDRNEIILYGGAIHLSKDIIYREDKTYSYGLVALPEGKGWGKSLKDTFVKSISQEHGIIKTTSDILEKIKIGDIMYILPIHSCLTANAMKKYFTLDGKELNYNIKC
ncbi:MAG: alanine racemase [Asgard group archaeon]|nr:alanine racemase [Asgard group archaeon]